MRKTQHSLCHYALSALLFSVFFCTKSVATDLYFIDAHSQVDHMVDNLDLIIQRMNSTGVNRTILASRSDRNPEMVADFAEIYSERILPAVRTKSGAYTRNRPKYYQKMRKQLDSGRFKAMAEILLYHAQKGNKAPEIVVYPEDDRVQFALNKAVEENWPFIIHIEFASLHGQQRKRFMDSMKVMLIAHPEHPFVLNHMGQLEPWEVGMLISKHKNIYFLTAHTTPVFVKRSNQPWVNMFARGKLTTKWRALLVKHPDRFVFALDNVWEKHWKTFYLAQMEYWQRAMRDLPPDIAHAVAHGNAERLWNISGTVKLSK